MRKPELVEALQDTVVIFVAVGISHCLALTTEGLVLGWGKNDNRQIGS